MNGPANALVSYFTGEPRQSKFYFILGIRSALVSSGALGGFDEFVVHSLAGLISFQNIALHGNPRRCASSHLEMSE